MESLEKGIEVIEANQHKWPAVETVLRIGLALEGWLMDAVMCVADEWEPAPLIAIARNKLALLGEEQLVDLWSRVLAEHRPAQDPDLQDYKLIDLGVLPSDFLQPNPPDRAERLARYLAWLRPRVVRGMIRGGRTSYPIPDIGLARLLSLQVPEEQPSATELTIARSVANVAGWLAMRGQPMSIEDFARIMALHPDAMLLKGEESQAFAKRQWERDAPERAAIHALISIASAADAIHGHTGPLEIALYQYKVGIELASNTPFELGAWNEVTLQKQLCRYLLDRGIVAVGTKFGRLETDLVTQNEDAFTVLECKVLTSVPSTTALERNLAQLLRYQETNPDLKGRRGVLVLYNYTDVPIFVPAEPVTGRIWLHAINVKAGPASAIGNSINIVSDAANRLRCISVGKPSKKSVASNTRRRSPRSRRR